jgi:hypothetical protein
MKENGGGGYAEKIGSEARISRAAGETFTLPNGELSNRHLSIPSNHMVTF